MAINQSEYEAAIRRADKAEEESAKRGDALRRVGLMTDSGDLDLYECARCRADGRIAIVGGMCGFCARDELNSRGLGKIRQEIAAGVLAQLAPHIMFPQDVEDKLHAAGVKTEDFEHYAAHVAIGFADALMCRLESETE